MTRRVLAAIGILLVAPALLNAQDTRWNRYTLDDLSGVYIRAEATEACQAAGVSVTDLQSSATRTLEAAQVQLLTQEAMLEAPGLPELRISIDCSTADGRLAYAVSLRVQQAAQMVRDPQVMLPEAVTWYSTGIGIAAPDGAQSAVAETLDDKLAEFSAAWMAANAEAEPPGSPLP